MIRVGSGLSWSKLVVGAAIAAIVTTISALPAAATWSLAAVDPDTGEVGVAVAGCGAVSLLGDPGAVLDTVALVPGRGAAVAQGSISPELVDRLEALLADSVVGQDGLAGDRPDEVLAAVTDASEDPLAANRQYAVAALSGPASVFTGAEVGQAGLPTVTVDAFSGATSTDRVAVQGVLVAGDDVVGDAVAEFDRARLEGESLARSLARGLRAGSEAGGDLDCGEQTALYAHLAVAEPGDSGAEPSVLLTVTVDGEDGQNPVVILSTALDDGDRGWIDAGRRPARTLPRLAILAVGLALAAAAVVVIRYGMGHRIGISRRSEGE